MSQNQNSGKLSRTFWFLVSGTFINRLGSFLSIFLAYYLTQKRGFSKEQVGVVLALLGMGSVLAGPLGGFLADRVGRRKSMLLATLLGASAMLQLGFAQTPAHIFLSAFMLGLLGDLYRPAVNAAIADLVPASDRIRAYGWNYWAANLGFSCASVMGGILSGLSFTWLFIVDAATTLVFGLLILLFVPESQPKLIDSENQGLYPRKRSTIFFEKLGSFFPYWDLVLLSFLGVQLLFEIVIYQAKITLPLTLADRGISARTFGLMFGVNGVMIVFLQPWLRKIIIYQKRANVLALSACFVGVGYSMNLIPLGIPIYVSSIIVWSLGEILMMSVVPSMMADLAPLHLRGVYQGSYQSMKSAAVLIAPVFGTWVLSRFGSTVLWLSCLFIGLCAAILNLVIAPARRRRFMTLHDEPGIVQREDGIHRP